MNATGYAFLGLTAIVGMLVAVLMFAVLKFAAAAREGGRKKGGSSGESALLAGALEEAIAKLKAQERATAARAEASERLSSEIVASLTSGLVVVDGEGVVQIVNPAATRILQVEATAGVAYARLLHEVSPLREVIAESLATSQPITRRTVTLARADGEMHLGVSVSPIAGARGRAGVICLFSDLTDVVLLEEQLRLKEALAVLGELTAGLAHEFRNGLATIHGYGRLLDPATLPDQERLYVEGIRSETQALGEVVTNFLNFAKPTPLVLARVDPRAIIERAAADVPQARPNVNGDFAAVLADDVLLRQAFSNLFRNSVDACSGSGEAAWIEASGHVDAQHGTMVVTVSDNGQGIPADALQRIFQPFVTLRPGGTGLGLAIVQKIVVGHNGRISAGNRKEGGATFTMTLPLADPPPAPKS